MTKARDLSKLLSTANNKIAGSNLDVSFENISDTGTEGTKVASGTTAQRGSTTGQWRFNATTGFFEGIGTGGALASLEPDPTVSSVDDGEVDSAGGGNQTIVVTGTNFNSGGTITFVGSSAEFNASTTTFNSTTQVTAVAPKSSFLNAQEPYKVKFTSATGKSGSSATGLINVDNAPTWSTSSGSLGSIQEDATGNHFTISASDPEGETVAYTETGGTNVTGSGLALNSSSGVISGDPTDVSGDTTVSFTARATAGSKTSDRAFSFIVTNNPLAGATEIYNSNTSGVGSGALTSQNNVNDVTSGIASTIGFSNWTGTKIHNLSDGGNCANWSNIVSQMNGNSGGLTITFWAREAQQNNAQYRSFDLYNRISEYTNWSGTHSLTTAYMSGINVRTLTGNSSWNVGDWHFHCHRYSKGATTQSQTSKFTTDNQNGGSLYTISGTASTGTNNQGAGFMGYDPTGAGGANSYNFEGQTGGWRVFNAELTDAQVSYVYNSGNGRF